MAWENYGNAFVIESAPAWTRRQYHRLGPRILVAGAGQRPGTNTPGNIVTGVLIGFSPRLSTPLARARAAAPTTTTTTAFRPTWRAASPEKIRHRQDRERKGADAQVASPFWTGPLRSPARLQNTFAHESFMDELAAHVKADPVEYRLRHLSDERLIDVLTAAREGWPTGKRVRRPSRAIAGPAWSPAAAFPACLRRRQRLHRHGGGSRSRSGHRQNHREADVAWRSTAGPFPIPTACAIRSKAARCRV